ncbi:hypothetical protein RDn1_324, partial [Candidatus Termititenax dinenymphae]
GGGIYFENSSPTLNHIRVIKNTATEVALTGNGIFLSSSSPIMNNILIAQNSGISTSGSGGSGGGIAIYSGSSPKISNAQITGNKAGSGGGIYKSDCSQSPAKFTNVEISGNKASTTNINTGGGGGIFYYNGGKDTLTDVKITGNTADFQGGGIFINNNSSPVLTNVQITGNTANTNGGGICYGQNCFSALTNVTVAGNYASENSGGIYFYDDGQLISNSIIYGNSAGNSNNNVNNFTATIYQRSLVEDAETASINGANIIANSDPLFESGDTYYATNTTAITGGDYRLKPGSLAIDRGDSKTYQTLAIHPATDLAGSVRIRNYSIDLGAYETDCPGVIPLENIKVQGASICAEITGGQSVTLIASCSNPVDAIFRWYETKDSQTALHTGNTFTTPPLEGTTYYLSADKEGDYCENSIRKKVTIAKKTVPQRYYVKENAVGDGSSWDNASGDLQMMINVACAKDTIFVAAGTYKPNRPNDDLKNISLNNRSNAFVLKEGVKIFGGFDKSIAGTDCPIAGRAKDANGIMTDTTILSGGNYSYHVVIGASLTPATVLDGFKITGGKANTNSDLIINGNADTIHQRHGAGMYLRAASPTLNNILITGNTATINGGGM